MKPSLQRTPVFFHFKRAFCFVVACDDLIHTVFDSDVERRTLKAFFRTDTVLSGKLKGESGAQKLLNKLKRESGAQKLLNELKRESGAQKLLNKLKREWCSKAVEYAEVRVWFQPSVHSGHSKQRPACWRVHVQINVPFKNSIPIKRMIGLIHSSLRPHTLVA
jgi:hypothetical protein